MKLEIFESYPGIGGRSVRILLAIILAWIVVPEYIYSVGGARYLLLGIALGLTFLYLLIHFFISYFDPHLKKWFGILLAAAPVVCVYLFGGNAGQMGALMFVGLSLLVAGFRADTSCEVMAIPNVILKKKSTLPSMVLFLIDNLEKKLTK